MINNCYGLGFLQFKAPWSLELHLLHLCSRGHSLYMQPLVLKLRQISPKFFLPKFVLSNAVEAVRFRDSGRGFEITYRGKQY